MATNTDHAREQAEAKLEHIQQLVEWLDHANECDGPENCEATHKAIIEGVGEYYAATGQEATPEQIERYHDSEAAEQAISEDPLSMEVRSGWYMPGTESTDHEPGEFRILLATGGPAVRIIGDLDGYSQPETARIEYQDWFTPWTEYPFAPDAEADLLRYCQQFYFGS